MVKDDGGVEFHALLRPSSLVRSQLKVHGCPLLSEPPSRPTRGTLRGTRRSTRLFPSG